MMGGWIAATLSGVVVFVLVQERGVAWSSRATHATILFCQRAMRRLTMARRQRAIEEQLDGMLSSLANALSASGSLMHAIEEVADSAPAPIGGILKEVQKEVRLGRSVEQALEHVSAKTGVRDLQMAFTQLVIGKRSGRDLSRVLSITAASLREMRRLEGVVRTRTAEGRGQAVVMGLVPPFLAVALHFINPAWLAPMWHHPVGWALLTLCAVLELSAMAMVRRIMAVDL